MKAVRKRFSVFVLGASASLLVASAVYADGRNGKRMLREMPYAVTEPAATGTHGRNALPRANAQQLAEPYLNKCQETSGRNAARSAAIVDVDACGIEILSN